MPTVVEIVRDIYVERGITSESLKVGKRLYGIGPEVAKRANTNGIYPKLFDIKAAMFVVKGQTLHESFGKFDTVTHQFTTERSFLENYCYCNGLFRGSMKETPACNVIINNLSLLPVGGHSMIIGTATPYSVYKPENSKLPKSAGLINDNLRVAKALHRTSNSFGVIVGNAVRPAAAISKAMLWRMTMKTAAVSVGRVSGGRGDTYEQLIRDQCERNTICKVVLLGSGSWPGSYDTNRKFAEYGINPDYQSPSIALTNMFPGLHIFAMVRMCTPGKSTGSSGYEIYHVHNGKEEVLYN